jgi:hypothetical protein
MSKIALSGNASGTGTLTIAAPNTSTDRTLTLPDSSGTVATAESTLSQFNASGSAPVYACRAWVNFNGTGTVAIRASGNVTSITDNGTGDYTVNFTTAMSDANYGYTATPQYRSGVASFGAALNFARLPTTTNFSLLTFNSGTSALLDSDYVSVAIFR